MLNRRWKLGKVGQRIFGKRTRKKYHETPTWGLVTDFWCPRGQYGLLQRIICLHWHIIRDSFQQFHSFRNWFLSGTGKVAGNKLKVIFQIHVDAYSMMCIPADNLIWTCEAWHPKKYVHGYMYMAASIQRVPDALYISLSTDMVNEAIPYYSDLV